MELREVINGSDAGTIGTFARIGWHQPPVRAVPAIGIFNLLAFEATIVNNCSFTVIRYEYSGNAAKIFVHMDMGIDP